MTSQGWLQIGLTLLIGLLISIPVGRYLARVVTDRTTPLDRLFDPIDNFIYLLIGRRICRRGNGLEGLYAAHAGDELRHGPDHFPDPGVSGLPAAQFPALPRHGAGARVQHGGQLYHQYRLAGLWRRDDAIELQPDGGDHLSDVHLGDDRVRRRHGVHPRLHGKGRRRQSGQFLPGSDPVHHARADAGRRSCLRC